MAYSVPALGPDANVHHSLARAVWASPGAPWQHSHARGARDGSCCFRRAPSNSVRACAANATNFAQVRLQLTLLTHVGFEAAVEFGGGTAQRHNRAQLARQYGVLMAQG